MTRPEDDVELIRNIPEVPSILKVITKITGMGFAAVARVTKDKWIACEVLDNIDFGLKAGGELRIETTICNEILDSRKAVTIDHVSEDPVYSTHHTPAMYGFQSYISMPIILSDGTFFGTLCAIDPRPNMVSSDEVVGMFRLFADLIAVHIDTRAKFLKSQQDLAEERAGHAHAREKLARSDETLARSRHDLWEERADHAHSKDELAAERDNAILREQFIAVLGHDLRNPLAAISGGTQLLMRRTNDEKSKGILQMMAASALRMGGLIENVMDFARGRLGGGITLQKESKLLEPMLTAVIEEIRAAHPDRKIETNFDLGNAFDGDHARLSQLFSNLLGNAVTHGAERQPITVEASLDEKSLRLAVANAGNEIPMSVQERLFQPFQRGGARSSMQGLGLGLFIASEIARAHGGTLEVSSDPERTKFTMTLPVG